MGGIRRRQFCRLTGAIAIALLTTSPLLAAPFQGGQIFVAYEANKIGVFADTVSLAGTKVMDVSVSPSIFTMATTLTGGGGVALDEFGNLYVTVNNFEGTGKSGVVKFNRDGSIAWKADSGGGLDYRGLVASATLDQVFVATAGGGGQRGIHVYRASNGARLSGSDFGGAFAFRDLAFDKDGNLYGLRQAGGGQLVVRRWAAGNFTGTGTAVFVAGATTTTYRNSDPRALVVDEDGNIYIALNSPRVVIKVRPDPVGGTGETSDIGTVLATYSTPTGTGTLIGLDYDPGVQRLFASHTATGIGQILWIGRDALSGSTMAAFGPNNLSGVRWLAVYPNARVRDGRVDGGGVGLVGLALPAPPPFLTLPPTPFALCPSP